MKVCDINQSEHIFDVQPNKYVTNVENKGIFNRNIDFHGQNFEQM